MVVGFTVCYPLYPGLSFNITKSKPMLISGSSGVGKTSLLRLLKQLWEPSGGSLNFFSLIFLFSGKLERCVSYNEVVFLPQNTYLPAGKISLKKQLLFPNLVEETEFGKVEYISCLILQMKRGPSPFWSLFPFPAYSLFVVIWTMTWTLNGTRFSHLESSSVSPLLVCF